MKHRSLVLLSLVLLSGCSARPPADDAGSSASSSDAAWLRYENKTAGYGISYPANWTVDENASVGENALMGVVIRRDRWGGMAIADLGMFDDAAYEAQSFLDDDTGYDLDPVETVSIDGHAAKLYSISDRADMDIGYPVEAVTRVDGDTVVLWGFYSDAADKDEFLSVFREMVATFRRSIARSSSTSSAASGTVLSTLSEVLAGAGDLSIPFKAGVPRGSWYDLSVLTQAGIRSILSYDERIPPDSLAWPYATTPDGLLFIRTSEDGGFRMFDRQGNDVSGDYPGYKNKEFSVTEAYNLDANRIVYGVHDADTHGRPEVIAGTHILHTAHGTGKIFPIFKVLFGGFSGGKRGGATTLWRPGWDPNSRSRRSRGVLR